MNQALALKIQESRKQFQCPAAETLHGAVKNKWWNMESFASSDAPDSYTDEAGKLEHNNKIRERAQICATYDPVIEKATEDVRLWRTSPEAIAGREAAALAMMEAAAVELEIPPSERSPEELRVALALARLDDRALASELASETLSPVALHATYICADASSRSLNPEEAVGVADGLVAVKQICVSHPNVAKATQQTALSEGAKHGVARLAYFTSALPNLHPDLARAVCRNQFTPLDAHGVIRSGALKLSEVLQILPKEQIELRHDLIAEQKECPREFFEELLPCAKKAVGMGSPSGFIAHMPADLLIDTLRSPGTPDAFVCAAARQRGNEFPAQLMGELLNGAVEKKNILVCGALLYGLSLPSPKELAPIDAVAEGYIDIDDWTEDGPKFKDGPKFEEFCEVARASYPDSSVPYTCYGTITQIGRNASGAVCISFLPDKSDKAFETSVSDFTDATCFSLAGTIAQGLAVAQSEQQPVKV